MIISTLLIKSTLERTVRCDESSTLSGHNFFVQTERMEVHGVTEFQKHALIAMMVIVVVVGSLALYCLFCKKKCRRSIPSNKRLVIPNKTWLGYLIKNYLGHQL